MIAINRIYRAGKLRRIQYPIDIGDTQFSVAFECYKFRNTIRNYNSEGQFGDETNEPWSSNNFTRQYEYNSASGRYSDDNSQVGLNGHSFIGEDITPNVSSVLFHVLKRTRYLNDDGYQVIVFVIADLEHSVFIFKIFWVQMDSPLNMDTATITVIIKNWLKANILSEMK